MAVVSMKKGTLLFGADTPITELNLIISGSFCISFPGGEYTLYKGEAPGICELSMVSHITSCTALEDSSVLTCPVSDITSLSAFLRENPDYCVVFTRSAFRQMNHLFKLQELAHFHCGSLYNDCTRDYTSYLSLCMRHQLKPRKLSLLSQLSPFMEDSLEAWANSYYDGFEHLLAGSASSFLSKEAAVPTGLIGLACGDYRSMLASLASLSEYEKQALSIYLNDSLDDLFDLYTALYLKLGADSPDADVLYAAISHMISRLKDSSHVNKLLFSQRTADFENSLKTMGIKTAAGSEEAAAQSEVSLEQLAGSLQAILDYSESEDSFCLNFKQLITQYKNSPDKNAADDGFRGLRQAIASGFYELYGRIFFRSITEASIPLPVRMFLYFGYVDEQLAGADNCARLAHFAEQLAGASSGYVYTLYDWLKAIYEGKKEPSRNEFDEDYTDHLHKLKLSGKISDKEEASLASDMRKKVEYELKNMFPTVNKMTFGRISTFCPVFSAHNVLKHLDSSFVSANSLSGLLSDIRTIDFSAFYREYVYSNPQAGIPKEFFHLEILPDIILMPNIGTRGVMWQEIEGRRRTTAARMMLSVFYLEDLQSALTRLTGEYRWEMCKRVQGPRWNDVSDRSLTSEYFDYIQFYRKSHELTADTKERIRGALQKAHNSYKEMFVRDYITYILFEGTGAPRLTKPSRTILFTYCPFSEKIRSALKTNPIYKDMTEHYELKKSQHLHKLDLLERRVENAAQKSPKELADERFYWEK